MRISPKRTIEVTKARVLRRAKDRTKTGVDRTVELCPRAVAVLERQLRLRGRFVAEGKVRHNALFFLEDGSPISDPEVTRKRWTATLARLPHIRRRGPYHARHSSVTWWLMIGANLLRTADQHGHSVQVMLNMYAKWLKGATPADIEAIRVAPEKRPGWTAATPPTDVLSPPASPEFGTNLALDEPQDAASARKNKEKAVAERVGFEPTCRNYPTIRFRVGAVMTTSVPLRRSPFGGRYTTQIRSVE